MSMHTVAKGKISFYLWLSSVPLCKCTTALLYINLLMENMGCFQILAIVAIAKQCSNEHKGAYILFKNFLIEFIGVTLVNKSI